MNNVFKMNYDKYIENSKIINDIKKSKKSKVSDNDFHIPDFTEYILILQNNYNVNQLKKIAKSYKIKVSGNKNELTTRIYSFLMISNYSIIIQKHARKYILQKFITLNNHSISKKLNCVNDTDFLSMSELSNLPISHFFTYFDEENKQLYGFDIVSIYNLYIKAANEKQKKINNPYTNIPFPNNLFNKINHFIKFAKTLKFSINLNSIDEENENIIDDDDIDMRIQAVFHKMDSLGNYTCSLWFTELNNVNILKFIRELQDIWSYRAQLSEETKRRICPPNGNPFASSYILRTPMSLLNINGTFLRKLAVQIIENMINNGVDRDSCSLGCFYVLGALTLVSPEAANTMSWLYQSVVHN
ncbi:MAG: hypothetical protein CXT73_05985 [Methanobacteriota archaeon]|nr:MAG: hypothetical protein CXT73_05985 [Euryarchaeota archaeon]